MIRSNLKSVPVIFLSCICMEVRELFDQQIHFAPEWVSGFVSNVFQDFSVAVIKVSHDLKLLKWLLWKLWPFWSAYSSF